MSHKIHCLKKLSNNEPVKTSQCGTVGAVRGVSGPEQPLSESRPRRHPLQSLAQTGHTQTDQLVFSISLKQNPSLAILNRHSDTWWFERLPAAPSCFQLIQFVSS